MHPVEFVRSHPLIARRPALRQFIKFSMVGVSNTTVDFVLFTLLTRVVGLHYLGANVFSFSVAATWSYFANRTWTFRDRSARIRSQFPKFALVSGVGLFLTSGLLFLFVDILHVYDLLAKALAIGIVLFWNFLVNRYWTFRGALVA